MDAKMIAAWEHFTHSGAWPDLPTTAPGYTLRVDRLDEALVTKLASAFGLSGAVEEIPQNEGGGWRVGPADGSAPAFTVWNSPTGDWSYSGSWVSEASCARVSTAVAEPATDAPLTTTVDGAATSPGGRPEATTAVVGKPELTEADCPTPTFPPTAELLATANRVIETAGLGTWQFDTEGPEFGYLSGFQSIDGLRSPMGLSFSFAPDGRLIWAAGTLASAVPAGSYPLISPEEGLRQLNDRTVMVAPAVGAADDVTAMPASTDEAAPATAVDLPSPEPRPMPVEPGSAPIERAVTDVRLALQMHWDVDNVVWLVPVYEFVTGDNGTVSVIAVTADYFQYEAPALTDSAVIDPAQPVVTDPTAANPAGPDASVTSPDAGSTVEPAPPTHPDLIGLDEDEAIKVIEQAGWTARVVMIDGVGRPVTADYRTDRLNLEVTAGKVTAVSVG